MRDQNVWARAPRRCGGGLADIDVTCADVTGTGG